MTVIESFRNFPGENFSESLFLVKSRSFGPSIYSSRAETKIFRGILLKSLRATFCQTSMNNKTCVWQSFLIRHFSSLTYLKYWVLRVIEQLLSQETEQMLLYFTTSSNFFQICTNHVTSWTIPRLICHYIDHH